MAVNVVNTSAYLLLQMSAAEICCDYLKELHLRVLDDWVLFGLLCYHRNVAGLSEWYHRDLD